MVKSLERILDEPLELFLNEHREEPFLEKPLPRFLEEYLNKVDSEGISGGIPKKTTCCTRRNYLFLKEKFMEGIPGAISGKAVESIPGKSSNESLEGPKE